MTDRPEQVITDVVDGVLSGPAWERWLMEHPEAADEVAIAQRVRALLETLQAAELDVPTDFETRLLARVQTDRTAHDLLDLGLSGVGRVILELLALFFAALPEPLPPAAAAD